MDAIRIAPRVTRAFEAGPEGLELLAHVLHPDAVPEAPDGWREVHL